MLLIHTALPFEAHPIIRGLGLRQTASPGGGRLYSDQAGKYALLVSGVGGEKPRKTLKALHDHLNARALSIDKALNIGLAADPGKRFPIGTALNIASVYHHGSDEPAFSLASFSDDLKSSTLYTIDTPCSDPSLFSEGESIPLLDMEGWYFADTLHSEYGFRQDTIHSVKVVSDYADRTSLDTRRLVSVYDRAVEALFADLIHQE